MSTRADIEEHGFAVLGEVFSPTEMKQLVVDLSRSGLKRSKAGVRHAMRTGGPGKKLGAPFYPLLVGRALLYGITNNRDNTRNQMFTYDALNRLTSAQNAGTDCAKKTVNNLTEYWGKLRRSLFSR